MLLACELKTVQQRNRTSEVSIIINTVMSSFLQQSSDTWEDFSWVSILYSTNKSTIQGLVFETIFMLNSFFQVILPLFSK